MTLTKQQQPATDPIDLLVPPPQPWWLRLIVAVAIVGGVGFVGFLWQFGYIRPSPDCCGSGGLGGAMALTPDGQAVTVNAGLFNSSPVDIVVTGAQAELEGAEVLSIGTVDPNRAIEYPIPTIADFPVTAHAGEFAEIVITFVPDQCSRSKAESGWGWVTLDLETPGSWHPTVGRSYRLPEPVKALDPGNFNVFAPPGRDQAENTDDPLLAACRLLGR